MSNQTKFTVQKIDVLRRKKELILGLCNLKQSFVQSDDLLRTYDLKNKNKIKKYRKSIN